MNNKFTKKLKKKQIFIIRMETKLKNHQNQQATAKAIKPIYLENPTLKLMALKKKLKIKIQKKGNILKTIIIICF